jgi:RNA polymerase sigma-70 factor (ECF subfamily)
MKTVPLNSLCDKIVFEKVYKQYSKDLYRFLTYSFQDKTLSEDITQNVFLKLWDQCEKFDLRNIKSLIFTMGKNLSLNEIKRNQKTEGKPVQEVAFSESPQDLLEEKQFKEKLTHSINQLNENERVVFLMNRIDNLTYHEIATQLEVSQKTVEKRMHHALKELNRSLGVDLKRKK